MDFVNPLILLKPTKNKTRGYIRVFCFICSYIVIQIIVAHLISFEDFTRNKGAKASGLWVLLPLFLSYVLTAIVDGLLFGQKNSRKP